jgi:hypothetical protein
MKNRQLLQWICIAGGILLAVVGVVLVIVNLLVGLLPAPPIRIVNPTPSEIAKTSVVMCRSKPDRTGLESVPIVHYKAGDTVGGFTIHSIDYLIGGYPQVSFEGPKSIYGTYEFRPSYAYSSPPNPDEWRLEFKPDPLLPFVTGNSEDCSNPSWQSQSYLAFNWKTHYKTLLFGWNITGSDILDKFNLTKKNPQTKSGAAHIILESYSSSSHGDISLFKSGTFGYSNYKFNEVRISD